MEKDIGKIPKNETTEIVVRIDDFGGRPGVTIREFVTSDRYTGFTKAGTRIAADKFLEFRDMINQIDLSELTSMASEAKPKKKVAKKQESKKVEEESKEAEGKPEEEAEEAVDY